MKSCCENDRSVNTLNITLASQAGQAGHWGGYYFAQ